MRSNLASIAVMLALPAMVACTPPSTSPAADSSDSSAGVLADIRDYVDTSDRSSPAPRVTLEQTDGQRFAFDDPGDKVTLLYFGYTSCPDVCPTTIADLTAGVQALPADIADRFTLRFVTTDPQRDTPAQLRAWLGAFAADVVGVRGPIGQVIEAAEAYGIYIKAPKVTKGNYEVTHGAQVLALHPDGTAVGYFRDGTTAQTYTKALPTVLEEAKQ